MGFVFGQLVGGIISTFVEPRWVIITAMTIAAPIKIGAAANPLNMELTMGLITTGSLFIGLMETQAATSSIFSLRNQEEIGTAGGLAGTIRSFVSVIAVAIYSTVLANRLNRTIPMYVPSAAEATDLPASSIDALIAGLSGDGPLTASAVPGLTAHIQESAETAYMYANSEAYKTVFYTSFAFGGIGIFLVLFVAKNDRSKEGYVAGHVHYPRQAKALEEEEG